MKSTTMEVCLLCLAWIQTNDVNWGSRRVYQITIKDKPPCRD
uniref:Uncharacterized protein n=1 Tax=Rhizophora mucronata TaxID=61149 RepID=A0A2P2M6N4_RHIMU